MPYRFWQDQTMLRVAFVIPYLRAAVAGPMAQAYVQPTDVMPTILLAIGQQALIRGHWKGTKTRSMVIMGCTICLMIRLRGIILR